MSKVENLRQAFSSLLMQYKNKYNKTANAQDLVDFAREMSRVGVNVFDSWDNIYDGDGIKGNSITSERYYADGNNLLFQTEDNQIVAYNLKTGHVEIAANEDLATLLDELDGGETGSITTQTLEDGTLELGNDEIKFFNSYKLVDKEVKTKDNPDQTASISSEDVKELLDEMVNKLKSLNLAGNIKDLAQYVKNNPNAAILENLKGIVKDYIISKFGGNIDSVLKNLTDLDVSQTQLNYLNKIREQVFNQIVDKTFTSIINAYNDKAEYSNNNIKFDIDEIKAVNLNFSVEAENTLTEEQLDPKSEDFINYLNNLDGDPDIDVTAEDQITIGKDGKITVKGKRVDQTIKTKDDIDGKFSISADDVQKILADIKSGKNEKDAVRDYLKELFGNDLNTILSKLTDENFSLSAAEYLKPVREAAFDKVVDIILSKVKAAFKDNAALDIKEMNIDIDSYSGINFTKEDFKNINFGQKLKPEDIDDKFVEYVRGLYPGRNISKEDIAVDSDGNITINSIKDTQTRTTASAGKMNLSGADVVMLKKMLANKTPTEQRNIILKFLLDKFGTSAKDNYSDVKFGGADGKALYNGDLAGYGFGKIDADTYKSMMNMLTNLTGAKLNNVNRGYQGDSWFETYFFGTTDDAYLAKYNWVKKDGNRITNIYDIINNVLNAVNNAKGETVQPCQDGLALNVQGDVGNISSKPRYGSVHVDPIGFNADGKRFDFVEDENNDGKFSGSEEFVGADTGWSDLIKYDLDHDGDIEGSELDNLMTLSRDTVTGEAKIMSASEAGIKKIDLSSYMTANETDEYGNITQGTFEIEYKDEEVTAKQTLDTDEYLNDTYGDLYEELDIPKKKP